MKLLAWLRSLAFALFHRSRISGELDEELRLHIANRAGDLERSGLERAEAERRARIEFGGYQRIKEECHDALGARYIETLVQDAGFGLRMLRKSPAFTAVAVLTIALGIGANTAIFSIVYAALLRPLPYWQPERLLTLGEARPLEGATMPMDAGSWSYVSYPDYLDWTRQSRTFQALAGFRGNAFVLRGAGEPQFVFAAQTTTNFFSTLGVRPFLGRSFRSGEDAPAGPYLAVLSYGIWKRQFGGDPRVVGRSVQLDANSVRIIGVLPRDFEFAPRGNAEIWLPLHLNADLATRRNLRWMRVIGRLAPGVSPAQAGMEMKTINSRLAAAYPQENGATQVVIIPLRDRIVGKIQALLLVLFGAVGFVLLIACANVANLLLVRAAGRRREFAIRAALGAGRGRLVSQLLAESLILAAAGGALGFFLGQWGTSLLIAAIPGAMLDAMPFLRDAHANLAVLAFLFGVVLITGLAFGLAPALQASGGGSGESLKEETRAVAGGVRTRLRNTLVVAEIAFSLVLLIGAGLMLKSLAALLHRNPGFDPTNLLTFTVGLPPDAYPKDDDARGFDQRFTARLRGVPGISGIASNSVVPLTGGGASIRFLIEGRPTAPGHEGEANIRDVSSGYFAVMKIPLLAGRFFNDSEDSAAAPKHVLVNEAWVKQYLRGANPIGKRVKFTYSPTQPFRQIVGVVGDVADAGLDSPDEAALFLPFAQDADSYINYIVRTAADAANAIPAVRAALRQIDPGLILIQPSTMEQIVAESPSVFLRRYPSFLIGSFAALALLLAVIGLYGLISYSVSQRGRELGIRIALGARRGDVIRLVLADGARLAVLGIAIGLAASLALTRLMRSLLFGVGAADPGTFIAVAAILTLVAAAACYVPACRAAGADPAVALRYE